MDVRAALVVCLALALAFSGSAAQLHSLAHAQHDLASASGAQGGKAPAPLNHSTEQCLVVHALDGTEAAYASPLEPDQFVTPAVLPTSAPRGESPALAFRSRAPPVPA